MRTFDFLRSLKRIPTVAGGVSCFIATRIVRLCRYAAAGFLCHLKVAVSSGGSGTVDHAGHRGVLAVHLAGHTVPAGVALMHAGVVLTGETHGLRADTHMLTKIGPGRLVG
jgi:hypothetical protein